MIQRVPLTVGHFELLEPDPIFVGFKPRMRIDLLLAMGKACAWVDTERAEVLCIGGYVARLPGVAWLWFLPSVRGKQCLGRVSRFFQRWVASLDDGIRVEATVLADFEAGNRWAEMLGLERETGEPMRLWDGRHDYHLYARVTGAPDSPV